MQVYITQLACKEDRLEVNKCYERQELCKEIRKYHTQKLELWLF